MAKPSPCIAAWITVDIESKRSMLPAEGAGMSSALAQLAQAFGRPSWTIKVCPLRLSKEVASDDLEGA